MTDCKQTTEPCPCCGDPHDGECRTANDDWLALTEAEQEAFIRDGLNDGQ